MSKSDEKFVSPVLPMKNVLGSLASGAVTGVAFHPWDKALNLATVEHRRFFDPRNFMHPWQGVGQTLFQRTFLGATYFGFQGWMKEKFYPVLREQVGLGETSAQFGVGMATGVGYALSNNWASAIKYNMWGRPDATTFTKTASEMWQKGGHKPFVTGTKATVVRDIKFGAVYEPLRQYLRKKFAELCPDAKPGAVHFVADMFAATPASVLSGPANYVRNKQYHEALKDSPPGVMDVLKKVADEARELSAKDRIRFFGNRFKVGAGTARLVVGMAAGQYVFDKFKDVLTDPEAHEESSPEQEKRTRTP